MYIKLVEDLASLGGRGLTGLEVILDAEHGVAYPFTILYLSPARRYHDQGINLFGGVGYP